MDRMGLKLFTVKSCNHRGMGGLDRFRASQLGGDKAIDRGAEAEEWLHSLMNFEYS